MLHAAQIWLDDLLMFGNRRSRACIRCLNVTSKRGRQTARRPRSATECRRFAIGVIAQTQLPDNEVVVVAHALSVVSDRGGLTHRQRVAALVVTWAQLG